MVDENLTPEQKARRNDDIKLLPRRRLLCVYAYSHGQNPSWTKGLFVTSYERTQRNMRIVEDRARGLSWTRIAHRRGVSDRQARRIVADFRASQPALHEWDPVEVVEETLGAYATAIEDLSLLAESTDHDSTKLGAIKSRLDVYHSRIDLLRAVGVMPRDLGYVGVALELRQIATRVVDVFESAGMPEQVKAQLLEAIDPRTALAPPPQPREHVGQLNGGVQGCR
jgi:hypothetical protein